jgi:hypothetical protein
MTSAAAISRSMTHARVSATLNRDLVKPLIDLNRGPLRLYP